MQSKYAVLLSFLMFSTTLSVLTTPVIGSNSDAMRFPQDSAVIDNVHKAFFVSPITEARYEISYDAAVGHLVYLLDGVEYDSVDSILVQEAALYPDGLYKLEPELRREIAGGESDTHITVVIYLTSQFSHDASTRVWASSAIKLQTLWNQRQALLDEIMSVQYLGPLPPQAASINAVLDAEFHAADTEYADSLVSLRQQIYAETQKLNAPFQGKIAMKIEDLGGNIVYRGKLVNVIGARISPAGLRELVKNPEVDYVYKNRIMNALLDISVPSINADDWWNAGYNTNTYKFVVSDTGVDSTHPALSAIVTDEEVFHDDGQTYPGYNDDPASTDDLHGHGTHVAGIVGSQDTTYRGVAYGLKGIVNAKFGWLRSDGNGGGSWLDAMEALDWAIGTAGASIGSLSYGDSTQGTGNGPFTKFIDAIVDDLGIPYAVAAGNDGPSADTVGQPGDSYNSLVVGAMDDRGTLSRLTDTIAGFSSRGPTADGRIKPDIVAPGQDTSNPNWGIYSSNYKWETQSDWVDYMGTSMASPHIGGALVLLANYLGPRAFALPAIPKALLMQNAEDRGAAGPDNNYGWGYVDLAPALVNRDKVYNETVSQTEPAFYLGSWTANDKATLVWQRHVVYRGAATPIQFYAASNLDLILYDGLSNTQVASSASAIDNVEQAEYANALGTAVLKVKALSIPLAFSEDSFALATQRQFNLAKPPTFQITWEGPTSIEAGNLFSLTANVTNTGDLTGFGAVGTLNVPAGLILLTGSNPVALGDMTPGSYKTSTWTFQSTSVGNKTLWFNVTSNSFGEALMGSSSHMIRVMDSFPPTINGLWAQPSPQMAGLNVNITADVTDNLGVFTTRADIVGPKGPVGNFTMRKNPSNSIWYIEQPYFVAGLHDVTVWASDLDRWTWAQTQFTIVDSTPPDILTHSAWPNPQQIHGSVNITAQIADQAGIDGAWAEISDPLGGRTNNSMSTNGVSFWFERQYDVLGGYSYRISASDPTGNWRIALGAFDIVDTIPPAISGLNANPNPQNVFGFVNISANIADVGGVVEAYVEVMDPLGGLTNATLSRLGDSFWDERSYDLLGDYAYTVSAVDIVNLWSVDSGSFSIVDPFLPTANAGSDAIIPWNTTMMFDGSGSSDNYGISEYVWTFFDAMPITLMGMTPTYRFSNLGVFTVTLNVTDFAGNWDTDTMTVTVRDLTKPVIAGPAATPSPQNPGLSVNISATITDNIAIGEVWVNVIDPYVVRTNLSMPNVGGNQYALARNYSIIGSYGYEIWAKDTSGNWNVASGVFEVRDMIKPVIVSVYVQPDPVEILTNTQIITEIQDNVGVTSVWVQIDLPSGGSAGNFSMVYDSGFGVYRKTYPTTALGLHSYAVWARDLAGNWANGSGQFMVQDTSKPTISPTNANIIREVDGLLNFTALAQDNFQIDKVHADLLGPMGAQVGNLTMFPAPNIGSNYYVLISLTEIGQYQVTLSVVDTSGNWGTSSAIINSVDTGQPVADAGPDQIVYIGDLVQFNGSASTDQHALANYTWTFMEDSEQITMIGPRPSYTFTQEGVYSVTLTVTDYAGNSDTDRMNVVVQLRNSGGDGGDPDGGDFLDVFVGGFLAFSPWSFILIFAIIILIIGAAVAKHKSNKEKRERAEMARDIARARQAAAMRAQIEEPPPPDEEFIEPAAEDFNEPSVPPPPEDDELGKAPAPPPPPEDL